MERIKNYIKENIETKQKSLDILPEQIKQAHNVLKQTIRTNKILIAGNGGSAADSQHFAAELIGRYKKERSSMPAIALTTDSSNLTAIGNDYGFNKVFSRQIEGLGKPGDTFIAITTSGNSENLIEAINQCKKQNIITIAFLGKDGGKIKEIVDIPIVVPSNNTPRIQETHILIIHILCELLEE